MLTGAAFRETHLERANLLGATGLTWEQGKDAFTDENTILPDYLLAEQARQTLVASPHNLTPAAPTPAARRTPTRRDQVTSPPPPVVEPRDNVVQMKSVRRHAPAAAKPQQVESGPKSKKAALSKHRKPGLVKPA